MAYCPDQGDAIWLSMSPQAGREQAGRRPALVLTPKGYNGKVGLAIVCPITNQSKNYVFEVALPSGLPVKGVVLSDHAKSLDWRHREAEFICSLPAATVDDVLAKLSALLGN